MNRFTFILSCFLFCACSSDANISMKSEKALHTAASASSNIVDTENNTVDTKETISQNVHRTEKASKIIKSGHMNFEVSNLKPAKSTVDEILKKCSGHYETVRYTPHYREALSLFSN